MAKIAKMAKFDEKTRFLMGETAKKVQKCVCGWLKNAIEWAQAKLVFQKVTAGVSPVKQSVRQNEMGGLIAKKNRPHVCGRCASRNNWMGQAPTS
jgi:hypothetical protein